MMKFKEVVYKKNNQNIVPRRIGNKLLLVPIKDTAEDLQKLYNLGNSVSKKIWELIDGKRNIEKITNKIIEEFEVDLKEAIQDVKNFMLELEKLNFIKRIPDKNGS